MAAPIASGFALINGPELYYEVPGTGKPLILLHGGVSADDAFGANLTKPAEGRQSIAALGRTAITSKSA